MTLNCRQEVYRCDYEATNYEPFSGLAHVGATVRVIWCQVPPYPSEEQLQTALKVHFDWTRHRQLVLRRSVDEARRNKISRRLANRGVLRDEYSTRLNLNFPIYCRVEELYDDVDGSV